MNTYNFLQLYGKSRGDVLNKLFTTFTTQTVPTDYFFRLSRLFLVNNYNQSKIPESTDTTTATISWEKSSLPRLNELVENYKSINPKLLFHIPRLVRHVNKKLDLSPTEEQNTILIDINKIIKKKNQLSLTSTQTQGKIIKTLKLLNIKYIEEYPMDGYTLDYFLPDLNIALEYSGPDHYYPIQTQLNEKTKFRHLQLVEYSGVKIVYINYWEWNRLDNDNVTINYFKKLLYEDYSIEKGPLFHENFNTLINLRIKN